MEAAVAAGASFDELARLAVERSVTAGELLAWWERLREAGTVAVDGTRGITRFRRS